MTAERRRAWAAGALLALLAYVPILVAAPGRMPADSKLYLYLDPWRLLGDAATTFDPRQFAGWVPHQHIAYLWPAGPWFWLFDTFGVPDWVAHRLWIGTLFVAAGLGVRWCARLLGLSAPAALTAALVYQLSPYLLPYVSRTSVMLLPWAGLGWIVGLTVRATRRADAANRARRWADPAALALVVLTVGAVNATALAMIVPAPVLWLVHTVWLGETRWRAAVATGARTAALAVAVSLWWVVMLIIQGRHGADVLPYSESLADVSFTATAPEVWRSLGYWLFYIRDRFAPTTTASLPYLASSLGLLVSFAVPVIALAALAGVRWRHRRFAALLLAAGLILAVGVHPIDDRSPLMRLLTGTGDSGLALALRSSTRAVPMAVLGAALALGSGVHALGGVTLSRPQWTRAPLPDVVAAGLVAILAIGNLPALWSGDLVDPALTRDEDPPVAWQDAADALSDPATRVLQLPGLEFGAFRWGYTVDQPLAALADSPLVTRDLLPLGSPAAMDLLFALDDRVQDGIAEPAAVATLARLLGAASIWLSNDAAYDRFDVTAPGLVGAWLDVAPGLGVPTGYGPLSSNRPTVEMADGRYLGSEAASGPAPTVSIYPVDGAPAVARAAARALIVSGSGDGLVDAAAAGLLSDTTALLYSAAAAPGELADALADSAGLLVTDSNRARARHWRSSQDTTGFTESASRDGAAPTELTEPAVGDARLPVFAPDGAPVDPDTLTTAEQRGPVIARASAYGQPFALLPEHRPFMAVDGDPSTAWIVAEHDDPLGATFEVTLTDPSALPAAVTITQYDAEYLQRQITRVSITPYGPGGVRLADAVPADLLPAADGPTTIALDLPAGTTRVVVTVEAVSGGLPGTAGAVAGVGFAEFDLGLGATQEVVRPPSDGLAAATADTPVALVLTRLRTDPADRWRDDPEPSLVREFTLPQARQLQVSATVRIDRRASDAELATLLGWPVSASTHLLGRPEHAAPAAIDGDPATSWITGYDAAPGAALQIGHVSEPVAELAVTQPVTGYTRITELTLASGTEQRVVAVSPDASGMARVTVDPPLPAGPLTVAISGTEPAFTTDRRFGDRFELPAAIVDIELAGLPELPDHAASTALADCVPIATIDGAPVTATLTTASTSEQPAWLGSLDLVALTCEPVRGGSLALPEGTHLVESATNGLPVQLDRLVLAEPFEAAPAAPSVSVDDPGSRQRSLAVTGCPDGCWVILGEGYNDAWRAQVDGIDLGAPTLLDGGFTGWWVGADVVGDGTFAVDVRWTAQRPLTIAYAISGLATAACLAILALARRHPLRLGSDPAAPADPADRTRRDGRGLTAPDRMGLDPSVPGARTRRDGRGLTPVPARTGRAGGGSPVLHVGRAVDRRTAVAVGVVWVVVGGLLAGWWGAAAGLIGAALTYAFRNRRVPELTAAATVAVLGAAIVIRERRLAPPPNGGWPHAFEAYHRFGLFAIAAVLVAAVIADDADDGADPDVPGSVPSAP